MERDQVLSSKISAKMERDFVLTLIDFESAATNILIIGLDNIVYEPDLLIYIVNNEFWIRLFIN